MGAMPNNRALRAVREQRGLALKQVADFAAISVDRLTDFERGDREPSRKQVERLADAYGVPLYSLFGSSIPNLAPLPQDFRKVDPQPASSLTPKGVRSLLSSERVSVYAKQLAVEVKYKPKDLNKAVRASKTTKLRATTMRNIFDEWHRPRASLLGFSGTLEQRFMSALRLFFEIQGGVLNVNDAPFQDFMGFFVEPEGGLPTIFVNRSVSSKKAQLFTLAHEYSHAILGEDGISNPFMPRNAVERTCNVFAAEFLAPMQEFARVVEALPKTTRSNPETLIAAASARSLLSRHAAAIRLVEGSYISQQELRTWRSKFVANPRFEKDEEKETVGGGGGVPHAKRLSELGHLAVVLSKRALDLRLIDRFDIANSLGLSQSLQDRAFALATKRFEIALT